MSDETDFRMGCIHLFNFLRVQYLNFWQRLFLFFRQLSEIITNNTDRMDIHFFFIDLISKKKKRNKIIKSSLTNFIWLFERQERKTGIQINAEEWTWAYCKALEGF